MAQNSMKPMNTGTSAFSICFTSIGTLPNKAMPLWSSHPRVYLDLDVTGEASCPYCGTRYALAGGARSGGGH